MMVFFTFSPQAPPNLRAAAKLSRSYQMHCQQRVEADTSNATAPSSKNTARLFYQAFVKPSNRSLSPWLLVPNAEEFRIAQSRQLLS